MPAPPPPEELLKAIREGTALIVCGAGVSLMATDRKAPSWQGLIKAGLEHCRRSGGDADLIAACETLIKSGRTENWLRAADDIQDMLGGQEGGDYRQFLKSQVGDLTANAPAVVEAIEAVHRHGNPVATTNYDDVLRKRLHCDAIVWTKPERMAERLSGTCDGVLHIHGWWAEPSSVVFSRRDYEAIRSKEKAQFLQQLSAHNYTLVFVGCGTAGLADQNVGELMRWFGDNWSGLGKQHFVLVRDADVTDPAWPKAVTPVSYGADYGELPGFLRSLVPAGSGSVIGALPPNPHMVGRKTRLDELVGHILSSDVPIVVPGGPGMGKTTLALAAAYDPRVAAHFGARRYFVNLEAVTSADAMVRAVGATVGSATTGSLRDVLAGIESLVASSPVLAILDNSETPWHADRAATEQQLAYLGDVASLTVVLTHRGETPTITGARKLKDIARLPADEAKALFVREAGGLFADDSDLEALVAALDGHPLSIVLMAAESDGRPSLAGLLQDYRTRRAELLKRGEGADRLSNVRVSLELSLARLASRPDATRLLGLVALMPAGLAEAHIATVLPDAEPDVARVLQKARLVDIAAGRITMLAPLRETAGPLSLATPKDEGRLVDLMLGIAAKGDRAGRSDWQTVRAEVEGESGNLNAAIVLGTRRGLVGPLARAVIGLAGYVRFTGRIGSESIEPAARALRAADHDGEAAHCIKSLGDIALARSDHETARQNYEEARPLYGRIGDVLGEANCIKHLGDIALRRSDHETARRDYEAARPLFVRVGDVLGEANCIKGLGDIALRRSDHDTARRHYDEARPLYGRVGAILGEANCILGLGDIALARSDHDTARRHYDEARPLYGRVGAILGEANCIQRLGDIALARSNHDTARENYEEARPLYGRIGDLLGEANCIRRLGDIALARSDYDTARENYEEAWPLYGRVGSVLGEANCIKGLGDIALERSDHDTARRNYEAARPLYARIGAILGEANCTLRLGDIALGRSDHETAQKNYDEARPLYGRIGDVLGEANCIKGLGNIALARSDRETARRHFEAARPLYERVGDVLGEANCTQSLGDIALARSDHETARSHYEAALGLYEKLPEPFSIGSTHLRLSVVACDDADRDRHRTAAEAAWRSIGREDLIGEHLKGGTG